MEMDINEIKSQLNSLKARLPIDPNKLDLEAQSQASLYREVGELVMNMKHIARVDKDHLEFVKAKIKRDIRENPGKHGISKPTNDSVDEACLINVEYQAALNTYSESQHLADIGNVLLEAAAQRKSTLRDAVSLYIHEYYMSAQDMKPERNKISAIDAEEVMKHRKALSNQRDQDNKEETYHE